jgi:hypothetical protein
MDGSAFSSRVLILPSFTTLHQAFPSAHSRVDYHLWQSGSADEKASGEPTSMTGNLDHTIGPDSDGFQAQHMREEPQQPPIIDLHLVRDQCIDCEVQSFVKGCLLSREPPAAVPNTVVGPYSKPSTTQKPPLPGYVHSLPAKIKPEDIAYLQAREALTVPGELQRKALLTAYTEFIHGTTPILDLNNLLLCIETDGAEGGRCSLMLFQAIMFIGVTFLDMKQVQMAGYLSKKDMEKAYFRKAKVILVKITPKIL